MGSRSMLSIGLSDQTSPKIQSPKILLTLINSSLLSYCYHSVYVVISFNLPQSDHIKQFPMHLFILPKLFLDQ
jgi:hypothetical protein